MEKEQQISKEKIKSRLLIMWTELIAKKKVIQDQIDDVNFFREQLEEGIFNE